MIMFSLAKINGQLTLRSCRFQMIAVVSKNGSTGNVSFKNIVAFSSMLDVRDPLQNVAVRKPDSDETESENKLELGGKFSLKQIVFLSKK